MRGFRWQLLALIVSITIFSIVVLFRFLDVPQSESTPTSLPANPTPESISTATETPPKPLPTQQPVTLEPQTSNDDIPTYREALVGNIQRLNPLLAPFNPVEEDITSLIFEGLVQINEYGEPVGDLASTWVVSRDGLEYVFQLRQDVLWQDGIPFTADDV
jgi:ABC-type transport system substrate-binding protein